MWVAQRNRPARITQPCQLSGSLCTTTTGMPAGTFALSLSQWLLDTFATARRLIASRCLKHDLKHDMTCYTHGCCCCSLCVVSLHSVFCDVSSIVCCAVMQRFRAAPGSPPDPELLAGSWTGAAVSSRLMCFHLVRLVTWMIMLAVGGVCGSYITVTGR